MENRITGIIAILLKLNAINNAKVAKRNIAILSDGVIPRINLAKCVIWNNDYVATENFLVSSS